MNNWNDTTFDPKKEGTYLVIAESLKGNVLKEEVEYSADDGWQIGNNWDVLLWKEVLL